MKQKMFLVAIVVMAASLLQAQSAKQLAREVYQNSGMNSIVKVLDQQFANQMNMNPTFATKPEAEPFKKAMLGVMSAKNIEKYLLDYLEEEVPLEELETMAGIYKDPFVNEFTALELSVQQPEKQQEMAAYKTQLVTNPPSAERLKLIDQLIENQNTAETTKEMTLGMVMAMMRGGNALQPEDKRMNEEQMMERMNQAFPANFETMINEAIQSNSLFIYKDVPDDKLAKYVAIWSSEAGKTTMANFMNAIQFSFEKVGEQMGKSLASVKK